MPTKLVSKCRQSAAKCEDIILQSPAFERRDVAVVRVIYSKARANLKTHWESAGGVRNCRNILVAAIRAVHRGAQAAVRARRVLECFARLRQSKGKFTDVLEVVGFCTQWSLSAPQDAIDYLLAAAKEMAWSDKKELDALVASVRRVASDMQERKLPGKLPDLSGKRAQRLVDRLSAWTNSTDRDSTDSKPVKHDLLQHTFKQHQRVGAGNNACGVMQELRAGWQDYTVSDLLPSVASNTGSAAAVRDIMVPKIVISKWKSDQTFSESDVTRSPKVTTPTTLHNRRDLTSVLKPCTRSRLTPPDEDIGWSSTASHVSDDITSLSGSSSPRQSSMITIETCENTPVELSFLAIPGARHASDVAATEVELASFPFRHEPISDAALVDNAGSDRTVSTEFVTEPHKESKTSELNLFGLGRYSVLAKPNLSDIDQAAYSRNTVREEDYCDFSRRRRSRRAGKQDRDIRSRGFALTWSGSIPPCSDTIPGMGRFGYDSSSENALRGEPAEFETDVAIAQWRSLKKPNLLSSVRSMPSLQKSTSSVIGQQTNNFRGTGLRNFPTPLKANTTMLAPIGPQDKQV